MRIKTETIYCDAKDCPERMVRWQEASLGGAEVFDAEAAGWRQADDGRDYCPDHAG
jgi:hypothetical protein